MSIFIIAAMPIVSAGDFSFNIYSPDEPIVTHEMTQISGSHRLIPNTIDKILPELWMSQYSIIEITEVPEWIQVTIPDNTPLTPPDGVSYTITMTIGLRENAPMNSEATIRMQITTGRYMRTIFPPWFPLCDEYTLDRSVAVQTGEWEIIDEDQSGTDDTNDDWFQEEKIVTSSRQAEIDTCFVLFIILIIFIILIAVFFITRQYP